MTPVPSASSMTQARRQWVDGFWDAYASKPIAPAGAYDLAYATGRVQDDALRLRHQAEFEQALFERRRLRPVVADGTRGD